MGDPANMQNDRKQKDMTVKRSSVQLILLVFCCIASLLRSFHLRGLESHQQSIPATSRPTNVNGTMHLMESTR